MRHLELRHVLEKTTTTTNTTNRQVDRTHGFFLLGAQREPALRAELFLGLAGYKKTRSIPRSPPPRGYTAATDSERNRYGESVL